MVQQSDQNFLEITSLFSGATEEVPFDRSFDFVIEANGIRTDRLRFFGKAHGVSGFFRLTGTLSCELDGSCARCLLPAKDELLVEVDFPIAKTEDELEDDFVLTDGERIDLLSVAEENLLLNFPLRLLCREDCKGICPTCGKNRNTNPCVCSQKTVDPRLAGLADFFK